MVSDRKTVVMMHGKTALKFIVVLVLVFCLCPSSVRVVATFSGTVLFPLLCSVLPFFPNTLIFHYIVKPFDAVHSVEL